MRTTARILSAQWWKELRSHRSLLLSLWALLPLALLATTRYERGDLFIPHDTPFIIGLLSAGLCFLVVGTSQFSMERRAGHAGWLSRIPAGMWSAFVAKLTALAIACVATFAWALMWGVLITAWLGLDHSGVWFSFVRFSPYNLAVSIGGMGILLWMSALGWRPGLAILGAPLIAIPLFWTLEWLGNNLGLFTVFLNYGGNGSYLTAQGLWPTWWVLLSVWIVAIVGPFGATWCAFAGQKFAASRRSKQISIGVLLAAFMPAWAAAGYFAWDANRIDPASEQFKIYQVQVAEGGKTAILIGREEGKIASRMTGLMVDLSTGVSRKLGATQGWMGIFRSKESNGLGQSVARYVCLDRVPDPRTEQDHIWFTAADGQLCDAPSKTRVDFNASLQSPPKVQDYWGQFEGLGIVYRDLSNRSTQRTSPDLLIYNHADTEFTSVPAPDFEVECVLPDFCFVRDKTQRLPLLRFDPKAATLTPDPILQLSDQLLGCTMDGRVLIARSHALHVYDPSAETWTTLSNEGTQPAELSKVHRAAGYANLPFGPTNQPFIRRLHPDKQMISHLGFIDLDLGAVYWMQDQECTVPVQSPAPGILIGLVGGNRIERWDFHAGKKERLTLKLQPDETP